MRGASRAASAKTVCKHLGGDSSRLRLPWPRDPCPRPIRYRRVSGGKSFFEESRCLCHDRLFGEGLPVKVCIGFGRGRQCCFGFRAASNGFSQRGWAARIMTYPDGETIAGKDPFPCVVAFHKISQVSIVMHHFCRGLWRSLLEVFCLPAVVNLFAR